MLLRVWRFFTLLLAALSLTMESAHVLELPQKMQYDAVTYAQVNGTLYLYYAVVGGAYQVGAIVLAAVLVFLVRGRPSFRWTLVGVLFLGLALGVWLAVVSPVNAEISTAMQAAPDSVPVLWMRMRDRWEYGHAAGFVLQLVGFAALLISILKETPKSWANPPLP